MSFITFFHLFIVFFMLCIIIIIWILFCHIYCRLYLTIISYYICFFLRCSMIWSDGCHPMGGVCSSVLTPSWIKNCHRLLPVDHLTSFLDQVWIVVPPPRVINDPPISYHWRLLQVTISATSGVLLPDILIMIIIMTLGEHNDHYMIMTIMIHKIKQDAADN